VPRRDQRVTAYTPGGARPLRSSPITNRLSGRPTAAWRCTAHGRVFHAHLTLAFADIPTARFTEVLRFVRKAEPIGPPSFLGAAGGLGEPWAAGALESRPIGDGTALCVTVAPF
jgi:hypothetical protein